MQKLAIDHVKEGLKRAKAKAVPFAYSTNGEAPILLFAEPGETKITLAQFRTRAAEVAAVSWEGGALFLGKLSHGDDTFTFRVDEKDSLGQINAAKMVRGLAKLAKASRITLLAKAVVVVGDDPKATATRAQTDNRAEARKRVVERLGDVSGALAQAATAHGDAALAKPVLTLLASLRDDFKLFLESRGAATGLTEGSSTKQEVAALVKQVERGLEDVSRAYVALKNSVQPTDASPLVLPVPDLDVDVDLVAKASKKVRAAVTAYEEAVGAFSLTEADHAHALHVLRTELLAWRVDHVDVDTDAAKATRTLLAEVEARLTEIDVARGLRAGQLSTTGGGDATGGASGSYFLGDGTQARAFVLKPSGQEALVGPTAQPGDGLRNELVGSVTGAWFRDHGIGVDTPDVQAVTVTSDMFERVGQRLADTGGGFGAGVKDKTQKAAAIRIVPKVTGVATDLIDRVHPTIPAIRLPMNTPDDRVTADATALFRQHDPTFAAASPHEQVQRVKAFLDKGGHRRESRRPANMTRADLTEDLTKGLLMCIATGQLDHSNLDNAVMSNDGDRPHLVPIDFGNAAPTAREAANFFDAEGRPIAKDPWALWVSFDESDDPIPPELLESIGKLPLDKLADTMEFEEDRAAEEVGEPVRGTNKSQRATRRFMLRALQQTLAYAKKQKPRPRLTPRVLHDVFVRRDATTGPFGKALSTMYEQVDKDFRAKKITSREPTAAHWNAAWKTFLDGLKVFLAGVT